MTVLSSTPASQPAWLEIKLDKGVLLSIIYGFLKPMCFNYFTTTVLLGHEAHPYLTLFQSLIQFVFFQVTGPTDQCVLSQPTAMRQLILIRHTLSTTCIDQRRQNWFLKLKSIEKTSLMTLPRNDLKLFKLEFSPYETTSSSMLSNDFFQINSQACICSF